MTTLETNAKKELEKKVLSHYAEEIETFEAYLEDLGYSSFTIQSYLYDVKIFFTFLYEKFSEFPSLPQIQKKDISEFLRKKHKGAAKTSRNRRLMTLRTFFKSLVKSDIIEINPALDVDMAKQDRDSFPTYLNDEELQLFFECIPKDEFYIRNKCMLMLMSLAGLRVIEVHNLNVTDIKRDLEDPGIRAFGKGNKARYIPLPIALYELLLEYEKFFRPTPKSGHENAFFLSRRGTRLSRRRIQEVSEESFENLKKRPEVSHLKQKKLSAHKLRHTFGTGLVREGIDLVTIQELMGHTNLNTTQIYTHANNEQKQKAMRRKDVSKFF